MAGSPQWKFRSARQFAKHLMKRLRAAGDNREARFEESSFRIVFHTQGQPVGSVNLTNLYSEYLHRRAPDRQRFLDDAVRSLLAPHKMLPDEFMDARSDIMPCLRSRNYFAGMEATAALEGGSSIPYLPIAEHLALAVVYDFPEAMIMISQEQLDLWGVTFYEACEIARENLASMDVIRFASIQGQLFVSATEDHYDASRLILDELVEELPITGTPIAMVPSRDKLMIVGSDDIEGIHAMLKMASSSLAEPWAVSGMPVARIGDEWTPWEPGPEHPCSAEVSRLRVQSLQTDYAEQIERLRELANFAPEHFATFNACHLPRTGRTTSYCNWVNGATQSLPRTEHLVLLTGEKTRKNVPERFCVTWHDAMPIIGQLLEPDDIYPTRYRIQAFPSREQLLLLPMAEIF